MQKWLTFVVAVALAGAAACSKDSTTTTPTPTATSPTTANISGRLPVQGSFSRTFATVNSGTVTVDLTNVSPSAVVGLGIGIPFGGVSSCTLNTAIRTAAAPTPQISATVDAKSSYCIVVFDAGTIAQPVTFDLTLVYP